MKNARNSVMNGSVNRKPAKPWLSRAFLRPPGTRLAVVTEVTVASLMSFETSTQGPAAGAAGPRWLLSGDRQALLLGIVDHRILPRLERRCRTLALVDRLALDRITGGAYVLLDRRPLPVLVDDVGHRGVDLVDLLAAVERVLLVQPGGVVEHRVERREQEPLVGEHLHRLLLRKDPARELGRCGGFLARLQDGQRRAAPVARRLVARVPHRQRLGLPLALGALGVVLQEDRPPGR